MKWNCSCNKTNYVNKLFYGQIVFIIDTKLFVFSHWQFHSIKHIFSSTYTFKICNCIGQNNGNITMNLFLVFYWKKCMGSSRWSGTAGHSQGHQWDRFWGHQSYFSCCTLWHPAWAWCRPHPSWIPTWSSALQPSCRATRSCAMRCP